MRTCRFWRVRAGSLYVNPEKWRMDDFHQVVVAVVCRGVRVGAEGVGRCVEEQTRSVCVPPVLLLNHFVCWIGAQSNEVRCIGVASHPTPDCWQPHCPVVL